MRISILLSAIFSLLAASAATDDQIPSATATDLPRHVNQLIRVSGVVRDVFPDERDVGYAFLVIQTKTGPVYTSVRNTNAPLDVKSLVNS